MNKAKTQSGFFQRLEVENYIERNPHDFSGLVRNVEKGNNKMFIEMKDSMINTFNVEDILEVSGVLKTEVSAKAEDFRRIKGIGFFDTYLDVNFARKIEKIVSISEQPLHTSGIDVLMDMILNSEIGLFILVKSFCPEIQGQELVKTLMICSLIGGSPPHKVFEQEPEKVPDHHVFSENIHMILLGEKGIGKSYLLKYTSELETDCKFLN